MGKRNKKNKKYQESNQKFKDRLFRKVFTNKADLLELYNAVNDTDYQNVDDLEVNTLDDVLYLSMKNDISFLIGGTMNLYEHQSSYNPNMPIRGFLYFARLYQSYAGERKLNLYGSVLQKLPIPRFLVFYNGEREEPDKTELRLTEAFGEPEEGREACLECVATMLNINYGHNLEIMKKCRRLEEYAAFVAKVREYVQKEQDRTAAVTRAVDECIAEGILADILIKQKSEVISMVLRSYMDEKYGKAMRKEGYEEGRKEGRKEGREFLNELNRRLIREQRWEELERAACDVEFQEKLLEEYGLGSENNQI